MDRSDMHWDNDSTGFWSCGTKADGAGFWTTTDAGLSWTKQARISDRIAGITRAPDGRLFVAGEFGGPVAVIDESNPAILKAEPLYRRGNNAFTSVAFGESVAVTSDGQILVDSLNGTNIAYFPGDNAQGQAWYASQCTGDEPSSYNPDESGTWCELHGASEDYLDSPDAVASQLASIEVHNDRFYAAGRYIADAGKVRLPSQRMDAAFHMQTVYVQNERDVGEMFDLEVSASGVIFAAGTNQSDNFPLIFRCDSASVDCYDSASWDILELDLFFVNDYWVEPASGSRDGRAIAVHGDTVVAVGNFVPNGKGGWALISRDGGITWEDLTPALNALVPGRERLQNVYDVHVFESGKILVVGNTSFVYTP
jgi:hypothetical protein